MKKSLAMLAFLPALLFGNPSAKAENLEEKLSSYPIIEKNFDYGINRPQNLVAYSLFKNAYLNPSGYLLIDENMPINTSEIKEVSSLFDKIKNQEINSYSEFINASENFSEYQKLLLFNAIENTLYTLNYDSELANNQAYSQETFFDRLQNSLINSEEREDNSLGICSQITTYGEKSLNDLGIRSSVNVGISENENLHAQIISKIEGGLAIIDSYKLLLVNTKNVEKAISAYQKNAGTFTIEHSLFESGEFQYRFITDEGENIFNLIGYDESIDPLKNFLINDLTKKVNATINIYSNGGVNYLRTNLGGLLLNKGTIIGDESSSLRNLDLNQVGMQKDFILGDKGYFYFNSSLINGEFYQDASEEAEKIKGKMWDAGINTIFLDKIKLAARMSKINLEDENVTLFQDWVLGVGVSYEIPTNRNILQPYILSQFNSFREEITDYLYTTKLSEIRVGAKTQIGNFSIDPYFVRRIWEQGLGGEVKFANDYLSVGIEGENTWATYEFCPDKLSLQARLSVFLKDLTINASYGLEQTDYDGEIENEHSFSLGGSLRF